MGQGPGGWEKIRVVVVRPGRDAAGGDAVGGGCGGWGCVHVIITSYYYASILLLYKRPTTIQAYYSIGGSALCAMDSQAPLK